MSTLRERIIQVRHILGFTQKEFGLNLGCSRDRISNVELGRVVPDDVFLTHICAVYRVRINWLKYGEGDIWEETKNDISYKIERYEKLPPLSRALVDCILDLSDKDHKILEAVWGNVAAAILSAHTPETHREESEWGDQSYGL